MSLTVKFVDEAPPVRIGDEWPVGYRVIRVEHRLSHAFECVPREHIVTCVPVEEPVLPKWGYDLRERVSVLERTMALTKQAPPHDCASLPAVLKCSESAFLAAGLERYGMKFKRALDAMERGDFGAQ